MLKPYFLISPVVRQHNFYDHFGKCWSCQGPWGEMPHRSYVKIRKLSAECIFHGEDSDGEYFPTQTRSLSTVSCPYRLVSYQQPHFHHKALYAMENQRNIYLTEGLHRWPAIWEIDRKVYETLTWMGQLYTLCNRYPCDTWLYRYIYIWIYRYPTNTWWKSWIHEFWAGSFPLLQQTETSKYQSELFPGSSDTDSFSYFSHHLLLSLLLLFCIVMPYIFLSNWPR